MAGKRSVSRKASSNDNNIAKGSANNSAPEKPSLSTLKNGLFGAANILWGPIDPEIAAIFIRCDDEIATGRANVGAVKALKIKMINEMLSPG